MREYEIIKPANEYELSEELRSGPLTGRVLDLLVRRQDVDELSVRRGDTSEEEVVKFHVEHLNVSRPVYIMGAIAVREAFIAARIDSIGDSDDDRDNTLKLITSE